MDTDRVPAARLQSEPEITAPVHALGEDTSGTVQPDRSNPSHRIVPPMSPRIDAAGPSTALSSTSSENLYDTSSLQPLRTNDDNLVQPIRQPTVRLPELNSGRRETETNNEIDWIVPKDEKVSNVLILNLNRANSFT